MPKLKKQLTKHIKHKCICIKKPL